MSFLCVEKCHFSINLMNFLTLMWDNLNIKYYSCIVLVCKNLFVDLLLQYNKFQVFNTSNVALLFKCGKLMTIIIS